MPRIAVLLALLLAGCSSSGTYLPMTVDVRDRISHEPVADALVVARPVHFFIPSADDPILDPEPPATTRAMTDATGAATLEVVVQHPVHVIVTAAGYEPLETELEQHPGRTEQATGWIDPESSVPDAGERKLLEVRFRP